jgi:hypothetical protein
MQLPRKWHAHNTMQSHAISQEGLTQATHPLQQAAVQTATSLKGPKVEVPGDPEAPREASEVVLPVTCRAIPWPLRAGRLPIPYSTKHLSSLLCTHTLQLFHADPTGSWPASTAQTMQKPGAMHMGPADQLLPTSMIRLLDPTRQHDCFVNQLEAAGCCCCHLNFPC